MKSILVRFKIKFYKYLSYKYWEFWPSNFFYIPIVFFYIYFIFKYRISITAISAVNPCFAFGGMAFDSKFDMLSKFFHFQENTAKSILISGDIQRNVNNIKNLLLEKKINYPFICKPDKGHRGNGFKIIRSEQDLFSYMRNCDRAFLIQEYIDYPLEYGIFWIKLPGETKGSVTSVTRKILPHLKGDGITKLSDLILKDERAKFLANVYFEKNKDSLDKVIPVDESYKICSTGNHCQGAIFEDGIEDLSGSTLEKIEKICNSVEGYDFGRMDIKFKDFSSLKNGSNFKILEVNGSEAESTHIYDRKNSIFYAYKTLFFQWDTLFKIAKMNRTRGYFGLGAKKLLLEYIKFFIENREIKSD